MTGRRDKAAANGAATGGPSLADGDAMGGAAAIGGDTGGAPDDRVMFPDDASARGEAEPTAIPADESILALARLLYAERRRRDRYFPAEIFGEPSWDILLDLFVSRAEGRRVPTTSACIGAQVPATTALRWLRVLEAKGLVEREDDRRDGRRTFVQLSDAGAAMVERFLISSRSTFEENAATVCPKDPATDSSGD